MLIAATLLIGRAKWLGVAPEMARTLEPPPAPADSMSLGLNARD